MLGMSLVSFDNLSRAFPYEALAKLTETVLDHHQHGGPMIRDEFQDLNKVS